ncbi:MAG: AAA family ATPase [Halodesulfurarchaeum sp.]
MGESEGIRVLAVASGKGGVGKTTTVVNLGAALARVGLDVAIVDVDLGMANLGAFVNLTDPPATIHDVLSESVSLEAASFTKDHLTVVPGSTDLDSFASANTDALADVVDSLRTDHDLVFLDVGAGLNHDIALSISLSDAVILVTTADVSSLTDASKTGRLVERLDRPVIGAVFTRTGEGTFEDVEGIATAFGTTNAVTVSVPYDERVPLSIRRGMPIVLMDPERPASRAYRRFGAKLVDTIGVQVPSGTPDDEFKWVDPETGREREPTDELFENREEVREIPLEDLIAEAGLTEGDEATKRGIRLLDRVRNRFT